MYRDMSQVISETERTRFCQQMKAGDCVPCEEEMGSSCQIQHRRALGPVALKLGKTKRSQRLGYREGLLSQGW